MANKIPRVPVREQDPKVRATNFEEVCYGYNAEEAQLEASRCLNCKNPRCVGACPVSVKIPQFISEIAAGNLRTRMPAGVAVRGKLHPRHQERACSYRKAGALCCRLEP